MKNLPDKLKNAALEIYNAKPGTKAIDIRRKMVKFPQVIEALSPVENYIFAASTSPQISEMNDAVLVSKAGPMFNFIAVDVGYNIPKNKDEWSYIQTRLVDVLKRYYSNLTLAEVKLAFELAMSGDLDGYLPCDSQGKPDKKHYQQFNFDFFAKILNAYKALQKEVIYKAYKALPAEKYHDEKNNEHEHKHSTAKRVLDIFLQYKYHGKFNVDIYNENIVYGFLYKLNLAGPVIVTNIDRKRAVNKLLQESETGLVNKYVASAIRRMKTQHPDVDAEAYIIARKREIKETFNELLTEEIQLNYER